MTDLKLEHYITVLQFSFVPFTSIYLPKLLCFLNHHEIDQMPGMLYQGKICNSSVVNDRL